MNLFGNRSIKCSDGGHHPDYQHKNVVIHISQVYLHVTKDIKKEAPDKFSKLMEDLLLPLVLGGTKSNLIRQGIYRRLHIMPPI